MIVYYWLMIEWERVQRTMEILKWLSRAARSLAQNVSVDTSTVSVGLSTCILERKKVKTLSPLAPAL